MVGYTRKSVPDIINGADITAPPLNAEFNQLAVAFEPISGHAHDGTTGSGPKISLTAAVSGVLPTINGGTGGRYNMSATTNPTAMADSVVGYVPGSLWLNTSTGRIFICANATSSSAVWLEIVGVANGNTVSPTTTNTVDFGTSVARYKNLFLSGMMDSQAVFTGAISADTASIATTSTFTGLLTANGGILNNGVFTNTGTFNMNGNVNIGDATADTVAVTARVGSNLVPSTDDLYDLGLTTNEWRNLWVDGTANIDNLIADAATISAGNIDGTAIGATNASTIRGTNITATTGFTGNLAGNVTGTTTGAHIGPVTGAVTGDVTGNITSAGTSTFNNVTINGTLDLNSGSVGTITGLSAPSNATDATTKTYVDAADALKVNKAGDTMSGTLTLSGGAKVTGLPTPTVNTDAATKLYVDTQIANLISSAPGTLDTLNEIATALGNDPNFATSMATELAKKLDKTGGSMTGVIDMGSNKITSLGTPTLNGDAATKAYVDTGDNLKVSKSGDTMSGALAMGSNKVTGVGTPTATADAATKGYVDTADALKLDKAGGTMSGAIAMGGSKVTGLGTPTDTADATTKSYVDGILGSATSAATSAAAASTSATNAATSASAAATSASAAEAAYDSFDDRYLGAKSSNPTVDNDGNPLLVGALYWNTANNEMRVWSGSAWSVAYLPSTGYQPLDGDLTAIAALTGTSGLVRKTAADTFTLDTATYLTGVTSGQVTTALGFTPYNSTNPSGYITASSLSAYLPLTGGTLTGGLNVTSGNVGIGTATPRGDLSIGHGGGGVVTTETIHLGYAQANFYGFRIAQAQDANQVAAGTFSIQRGTTTAWADALTITNSGNVTASVDVRAPIFYDSDNTAFYLDPNSTGTSLNVAGNILAAGNVGIGTSTPNGKTEIVSSGVQTSLTLRNTSSANATYTEILFAPFTGTTAASSAIRNTYTGNNFGALEFCTTNSASAPTERMRVDGNGNVGIGVTSPSVKLAVAGTIESTTGGFKFPDGTTQTSAGGAVSYPQNIQSSNYTLILSDAGKHIYSANTGAQTITIPTNASVAFPIGTVIAIANLGTTRIVLSASGVSVCSSNSNTAIPRPFLPLGAIAQLLKISTNVWKATFGVVENIPITATLLYIAGGGGGGSDADGSGGGGGAGGYVTGTFELANTLTITVGGGGAIATSGSSSLITGLTTAVGGGGGGIQAGAIGGSGGGGGGNAVNNGGAATSGQGFKGGNSGGSYGSGGGGGASEAGPDAIQYAPTRGGNGLASSITGSSVTRGGGGGGGNIFAGTGPVGGTGGGGGGAGANVSGGAGTTNTGSGGGGGIGGKPAGVGGSGVVIISTTFVAASTTGSPTVTTSGSNNIYVFNSSGTITF